MGRRTVAQLANRIKRVLSPTRVNDLGRRIGFCYRERLMTPYRLVLSLLASHAMGPVETLADIHRQFNALFAMTVAYKPFHNPLSKDTFSALMREVLCEILRHWTVEVLRPKAHEPLKEFGWILIQDGSSFALKDALHEHYPDRGYFDRKYLSAVNRAGGYYGVRASASINPIVRNAYDSRGEELSEASGRRLNEWALPSDGVVDLDVVWGTGAKALEGRIVAHWNAEEGRYTWLVTNLSRGTRQRR